MLHLQTVRRRLGEYILWVQSPTWTRQANGAELPSAAAIRAFCSGANFAEDLPKAVQELQTHSPVTLTTVKGAGRGLVARELIEIGATIHRERPFVCHPTLSNVEKVCYHCLAVLSGAAVLCKGQFRFCSADCLSSAQASYLKVEENSDYGALHKYCQSAEERFPLLAKRLVCSGLRSRASEVFRDLWFLAHAKVPEPLPQPWAHSLALLLQGTLAAMPPSEGPRTVRAAVEKTVTSEWYSAVLARLHINTFRVDCVFPPEGGLEAMAASVIGGQEDSSFSGSALYIAASLFNHSCCPNVNATFNENNGELFLTAATRIAAGEQLCISYIDSTLPGEQRRQQLHWAYGFRCACERCKEGL